MTTVNALSEVAALMGDPARASMLSLLMDGRAHPANDPAFQSLRSGDRILEIIDSA